MSMNMNHQYNVRLCSSGAVGRTSVLPDLLYNAEDS